MNFVKNFLFLVVLSGFVLLSASSSYAQDNPASTNYFLKSYSTSAGGDESMDSTNYSMEGVAGEQIGDLANSTNFDNLPGLLYTQMANTAPVPTITNDSDYVNKLLVQLDNAGNPSDAKFAIAISDDNFVTTEYIQSDNTVGASLGAEDWQTYADWGGASGEFVVGLDPNTTYYFKVKAEHGLFTEGPWGPVTTGATSGLQISFDIDVSSIDEETASPYTVDLGSLSTSSVTTATDKVWVDFATNAPGGGYVYLFGTNGGLYSSTNGYTINAVSGNLSSLDEGFGVQYSSVAETSGGPMAVTSPYDGTGEVVGTVDTNPQEIFSTSSAPIVAGRASFTIKAKVDELTPASGDYSDTITIISAASF